MTSTYPHAPHRGIVLLALAAMSLAARPLSAQKTEFSRSEREARFKVEAGPAQRVRSSIVGRLAGKEVRELATPERHGSSAK